MMRPWSMMARRFAKRVRLVHVVRSQDDGFALPVVIAHDVPKQQPGLRIQAGGRLVQEQHRGVVHHGAGNGEALHHAAGKAAHHLVGAVGQLEAVEQLGGALLALAGRLPEVSAVKEQNFAGGEGEIQVGPLRHHPDQPLGRHLLPPHVVFADERAAGGGADARGQDADGGGFARAVGAQQAEDPAALDFERNAVESHHFEFLARAFGKAGLPWREHRPAAGGSGRRRVIDLAQVVDFDADGHGASGRPWGGRPVHTL